MADKNLAYPDLVPARVRRGSVVHDQGAVAGPGDIVRISLEEAEKLIKRGILAPMAGGDPDSPVGLGPILSESAPNVQTVQSQA